MSGYAETKVYSERKLAELRTDLASFVPPGELVVTCGSYARREAVADSDLDFFAVTRGSSKEAAPPWFGALEASVIRLIGKLPSRDGAFSKVVSRSALLRHYGGSKDTNRSITRRMLYLLEGEYLTNEAEFLKIRREIVERYVKNTPSDHQLAFYLLNDVIRYWRTMAVDYAQKTYQAKNKKPYAIRNVKLVFSRKLIYASGLFSIALTANRRKDDKLAILDMLFSMTPTDRVKYICGEPQAQRLFEIYDIFLEKMSDPVIRKHLETLKRSEKGTDKVFREIKNEGHYFSRELMGLFDRTFHASHPIHMAVVF
jgi:predicted nucleotidyltransferase